MDIDRCWSVLAGTVNEYPSFFLPGDIDTIRINDGRSAVGVPSAHERENVELLKYAL